MASGETSSEALAAEVIAAELDRARAITEQDIPTIANYLSDEVVYQHATGLKNTKAELLADFSGARRTFSRGDDLAVHMIGNTGILTGGYTIQFEPNEDGTPGRYISSIGLQVWMKGDDGWKLVAHHGAKKLEL